MAGLVMHAETTGHRIYKKESYILYTNMTFGFSSFLDVATRISYHCDWIQRATDGEVKCQQKATGGVKASTTKGY
jgi:hypothetical protein